MKLQLTWVAPVAAAVIGLGAGVHPTQPAVDAGGPPSLVVGDEGMVATDPLFNGPQVRAVRVLEEGPYLEIEWDRYVDEIAVVDPANLELRSGSANVDLVRPSESGPTDSIFFDRDNRRAARSAGRTMARLPADMHMASVAIVGDVDPSGPLRLEIEGSSIKDAAGRPARDMVLVDIPRVSFYSQERATASGVSVKASSRVGLEAISIGASQVDVQLGGPDDRIAARMAERGCTLAVFGADEIAQLIPEHRRGFDPDTYEVEGYGGTVWNDCVSSVSERNLLRTRGSEDPSRNTGYPNENILVHEFGHAVRLVGIETLPDRALSGALDDAYENARATGRWPNTYAISNIDEYFATLSAIWFDGMAEAPTWDDGVRGPINTRAELRLYDPLAYELLSRIYPAASMPAPWDVPGPDDHHGGLDLAAPLLSDIEVLALPRCMGSRAVVAVTIRNRSSQPVDARIESPFGSLDVTSLQPGRGASRVFTSRRPMLTGDTAVVSLTTVLDGRSWTERREVGYDGITC